ncbi:hypothetical protein AAFH96_05215 [Polymorphospora sp. 2-325]|uniref:Band 7 domain-containing protein n=1 Tax=Polymorphospora lycopeni TaxID=3140240 RepID=A0ABV5CL03_9ACTN
MSTTFWPLLTERTLGPAKSRLLLFARRDVTELPRQEPGTALVFTIGDRYEVLHERRHLTGREDIVVEAVAVSLVDVRERFVPVDILIPSASAADDFRIRVVFRCQVTDPEAVVRDGLTDISVSLGDYLRRDRRLESLGAMSGIDDLNEVRESVTAQVKAYCTVHPPRLSGVEVVFSTVEVSKPTGLVEHASRMRDEQWRQLEQRLRRSFEADDAGWIADLIRCGPEGVVALAISRGDITAGQAADRAYQVTDEKQRKLAEMLALLQKDGHLDRLRVDADILVDAFTDSITPRRAAAGPELGKVDREWERRGIAGKPARTEDLVLDEDELDDDDIER